MGTKKRYDYHYTKCDTLTSMKAKVVSCEARPLLRYKIDGKIIEDTRYETIFRLTDGTEIASYSKRVFADSKPHVDEIIDVSFSFCKMPNGNYLIYA